VIYNNKEVFTEETFSYSKAQIGDYVEQAVVDDAMDMLPPANMSSFSAQIGEPYSHHYDPKAGRFRPVFATFKRITSGPNGIWQYCGHCFRRENEERGFDPPYVKG
jgi:hypothetical protein